MVVFDAGALLSGALRHGTAPAVSSHAASVTPGQHPGAAPFSLDVCAAEIECRSFSLGLLLDRWVVRWRCCWPSRACAFVPRPPPSRISAVVRAPGVDGRWLCRTLTRRSIRNQLFQVQRVDSGRSLIADMSEGLKAYSPDPYGSRRRSWIACSGVVATRHQGVFSQL